MSERSQLYARAPCGLLVTDAEGTILDANDTFCAWTGYAPYDLARQRIDMLLPVGARLFRQTHLLPLLEMQRSVAEVQLELKCHDGSRLPVLSSVARVRDHGMPRQDEYAFMLTQDRRKYELELLHAKRSAESALDERNAALASLETKQAELREANRQLRLQHESKDRFLAILAHELRNPLVPLRSGLDLLRLRGAAADPLMDKTLGVFERQVHFIARLVDDLMDTARIGQGKLVLELAPVKLSEVVQQAIETTSPKIEQAGQRLICRAGDDSLLMGDFFRLSQVLINLLNNASKYTPGGGTVELVYGNGEGESWVLVRDNGIGIRRERLATIFDMFSQEEEAASRAQGGIGIGLALVKGLVELHDGRVSVDSAGLGEGSVFRIVLPSLHS